MKKMILLVLLFASLASGTALAGTSALPTSYDININLGANSQILDDGVTWDYYNLTDGGYQSYGDVSFSVSGDLDLPVMVFDPQFQGYAPSVVGGFFGFDIDAALEQTYILTAYGIGTAPYLMFVSPATGTLLSTGTKSLGGDSYFYSAYQVTPLHDSGYDYIYPYYVGGVNAVQLTPTPEPASVILLGLGVTLASAIRRKRTSETC